MDSYFKKKLWCRYFRFIAFPNSMIAHIHLLLVAEEISTPRKDQGWNRSNWLEVEVSQRKVYKKGGEEIMEYCFHFSLVRISFFILILTEKVITNKHRLICTSATLPSFFMLVYKPSPQINSHRILDIHTCLNSYMLS